MKIKIEVVFDTDIQKDLDALQEFGKALELGASYDTGSESQTESYRTT